MYLRFVWHVDCVDVSYIVTIESSREWCDEFVRS